MIHTIFPLCIGEYFYSYHEDYKKLFLSKINSLICYESDGSLLAGEATGINDIHTDPDFYTLFKFISDSCVQHFQELNFDHSVFDIMISKTWLTVLDQNSSLPVHMHETSHYSFVYYVSAPENSDLLAFLIDRNPNEPFHGAFYDHGDSNVKTLVTSYNNLNSLTWKFVPKQGKLFLFPGNAKHYTEKISQKQNEWRLSIAGDILLCYKQDQKPNYPTGLYPTSQWRKYT
jgi:hypothetical protein